MSDLLNHFNYYELQYIDKHSPEPTSNIEIYTQEFTKKKPICKVVRSNIPTITINECIKNLNTYENQLSDRKLQSERLSTYVVDSIGIGKSMMDDEEDCISQSEIDYFFDNCSKNVAPVLTPRNLLKSNRSKSGSKDDSSDYQQTSRSNIRVYKTKCQIDDINSKIQFDGYIILEGPKYNWIPNLKYSSSFEIDYKSDRGRLYLKEQEIVSCRNADEVHEQI